MLGGLFIYDIFFVFGSDVMMTVATKIDAPVVLKAPNPPDSIQPSIAASKDGVGVDRSFT